MSISTRLGGNATGLPGGTVTRRGLLRAAGPAAAGLAVAATCSAASTAAGSHDNRLTALAVEFLDLDVVLKTVPSGTASHDELMDRYHEIEVEMAATPADSLAGIVAKAHCAQSPSQRDFAVVVAQSTTDDVWRLFGGGAQ